MSRLSQRLYVLSRIGWGDHGASASKPNQEPSMSATRQSRHVALSLEASRQSALRRVRLRVALFIIAFGMTAPALLGAEEHSHWSYSGSTGPAKWGTLEHDYGSCALGKVQSPIDIRDDDVRKADLPAIDFEYKPSKLSIIDNGHTIQVNYARGSFITVNGRRYELVQFHFHKPSEEEINDKAYDMVAHLVHRDTEGKLAVVAVLLTSGRANPLIDTLWSHLPQDRTRGRCSEHQRCGPPFRKRRLLHLRGVAHHAAMHRRCHMVRSEKPAVRFRGSGCAFRCGLPDERSPGATTQWSGDSGKPVADVSSQRLRFATARCHKVSADTLV
jgi:carbonic anhydrase